MKSRISKRGITLVDNATFYVRECLKKTVAIICLLYIPQDIDYWVQIIKGAFSPTRGA